MRAQSGFTFIKLLVEDRPSGAVSVITQKETAEFFGWDKAFPEWKPRTQLGLDGRPMKYAWSTSASRHFRGGDRLRICRVPSTSGHPAGYTHSFRMMGGWSRKHLVALAHVAGDRFEWMEGTYGQRVKRDVWQSLVR